MPPADGPGLPPPRPLDHPRAIERFQSSLIQWYAERRRDLPWRRTSDPYGIWISEIMLQQTTVRTVESRWTRFLNRFPSIIALADSPLDDVLNEWTGLGYYARARNLHAAAIRVRDDFGGALPADFALLLALPGMGRYTAAAVASIAFGQAVAVLDANVERVLARLLADGGDVRSARTKARLWDEAQRLLDPASPGDWNQAMMELGAMVCLPKAPQCAACPVREGCAARAEGAPERYPVKAPRPEMEDVREVALVIRDGDRVLLLQRPDRGSFAGMWEVPRLSLAKEESSRDGVLRAGRELVGVPAEARSPVLEINHVVMRRKIRLAVWEARLLPGRPRLLVHDRLEWVTPADWLTRPLSTTQRRIARYLLVGHEEEAPSPVVGQDGTPDLFTPPGE